MAHPRITMAFSLVILVATAFLYMDIPKGFLPSEDQGQLFAFTEGIQGISFEDMMRHQQEAAKIVGESPYVANYMSTVGGGGVNAALNYGRIFARLTDRKHAATRRQELLKNCGPSWRRFPASMSICKIFRPSALAAQLTKSQYQFTLQSPDTNELYQYAPLLEAEVARHPATAGRDQRFADQESAGHRQHRSR